MKSASASIGLINPKTPDNVHSVMRAAGNFRVSSVFYTGERYLKALRWNPNVSDIRCKVGATIPLTAVACLLEAVPAKTKIVCIEFVENAEPLTNFQHPQHALYVFGPEDSTITQDIIDRANAVIYIPTVGCMNLAAAVNVVLYDRFLKSDNRSLFENNALILNSRDANNWMVVNNGSK